MLIIDTKISYSSSCESLRNPRRHGRDSQLGYIWRTPTNAREYYQWCSNSRRDRLLSLNGVHFCHRTRLMHVLYDFTRLTDCLLFLAKCFSAGEQSFFPLHNVTPCIILSS